MGEWEVEVGKKAEEEIGRKPKWWKRFVDDVVGVWKGSKEEFLRFVEICNGIEQRIKVTYELCEKEAVFLDVRMIRQDGGEVTTELYIKPTDRTRYPKTYKMIYLYARLERANSWKDPSLVKPLSRF